MMYLTRIRATTTPRSSFCKTLEDYVPKIHIYVSTTSISGFSSCASFSRSVVGTKVELGLHARVHQIRLHHVLHDRRGIFSFKDIFFIVWEQVRSQGRTLDGASVTLSSSWRQKPIQAVKFWALHKARVDNSLYAQNRRVREDYLPKSSQTHHHDQLCKVYGRREWTKSNKVGIDDTKELDEEKLLFMRCISIIDPL